MSGIINDARIFYQDVAPEFVVMRRYIKSGIVYYMNNGHIELRSRDDNHIIKEEKMTSKTIDNLKSEFEEDEKRWELTKKQSEEFRREVEAGRTW